MVVGRHELEKACAVGPRECVDVLQRQQLLLIMISLMKEGMSHYAKTTYVLPLQLPLLLLERNLNIRLNICTYQARINKYPHQFVVLGATSLPASLCEHRDCWDAGTDASQGEDRRPRPCLPH